MSGIISERSAAHQLGPRGRRSHHGCVCCNSEGEWKSACVRTRIKTSGILFCMFIKRGYSRRRGKKRLGGKLDQPRQRVSGSVYDELRPLEMCRSVLKGS
ncbi:hypothetical protein KP509_26G028100 [Ceratopteris richardii]|uniref:Uncharacterized protein n=1 Tax=Ceratopteris richardii TaxID=49495 RepID=A0A8T2RJ81_CERRI|nr:hypothetical protein KP509_26G028100 [Ceratopteris richardii]